MEEHADRLLPLLGDLAGYQPAADARQAALECLAMLAVGLPRQVHPVAMMPTI